MTVRIRIPENNTRFIPGEVIAGQVQWMLNEAPPAIELRLFWYTRGKGTVDVQIQDELRIENPPPRGERDFKFQTPYAPYSFSGKLISLIWALEAVVERSSEVERLDLIIAPNGIEVELYQHARQG